MELPRRKFLAMVGLGGVGIGLAVCSPAATPTPMPAGMNMGGDNGTPSAEHRDADHEAGIKKFVADAATNPKTFWPANMPFKMDGDVEVFEIACRGGSVGDSARGYRGCAQLQRRRAAPSDSCDGE